MLANLAIAQRGIGDLAGAEANFRRALTAASLHSRRNRGPIMTDLAEIRCRRGDVSEGLSLLREGEPLMRADYPKAPWRAAWLVNTRGLCLLLRGDQAGAAPLLNESVAVIRAKWQPGSLYGAAVTERNRLLAADARRSA